MKKISGVAIIFSLVLILSSCKWEVPQKVSVNSKADYNFSFGSFQKSFEEDINISSMLENVDYPNVNLYDYYPGEKDSKVQEYLLKLPVQEIPVDFGRYFTETNLSRSISGLSFEKQIEIPVIDFAFDVKLDMSPINTAVNAIFTLTGPATSHNLSTELTTAQATAGVTFSSISYKTGYFNVYCEGMDGETVSISGEGEYGRTIRVATFYNGVARININDIEFKPNNMEIQFSNDQLSNVFVTSIDESSQIKGVSGFTGEMPVTISQTAKGLSSLGNVESCVIGKDSTLGIDFAIPSQWQHVTADYELQFHGGIETKKGEFTSRENPSKLDLEDATISQGEIEVVTDLKLKMNNATLTLANNPSIKISSDIETIKSVVVKLSDDSLSLDSRQEVSDQMIETIKELTLNDCGIEGTYTNTLPEGNDVTMSVSSAFFALDNQSTTIAAGKTDESYKLLGPSADRKVKFSKDANPEANVFDAFDFKVNLGFPGDDPSKITITNVEPGETYTLALNIGTVINWKEITLVSPSVDGESKTIGFGFNPTTILDALNGGFGSELAGKLKYPEIMMYLYFTVPEDSNFANVKFTDSAIRMYYGNSLHQEDTNEAHKQSILGKKETLDPANVPDLKEKDGYATAIIANEPKSLAVDISQLFNATEVDPDYQLCVDYEMHLSGLDTVTIKREDIANSSVATIGLYAFVHIPLKFVVKEDVHLSLNELMGMAAAEGEEASDLFGRTEPSGLGELDNYMTAFRSAAIIYKPSALPFYASGLSLNIDKLGNGEYKEYKFDRDVEDKFEIEKTDLYKMLEVYPYNPGLNIDITEDSDFSIPREIKLDIALSLNLKTDGTISLMGGN